MKPKRIRIGYQSTGKSGFISSIVNNGHFLRGLATFADVVSMPFDGSEADFEKLDALKLDYLLADIMDYGPLQFLLREKTGRQIPLMLLLHTVWGWTDGLISIAPLLRPEDIVIAISRNGKAFFSKITDHFKIHVIPIPQDVRAIQRKLRSPRKNPKKTIAYLGCLAPWKGIEMLIDCLPDIIRKTGGCCLEIIGPLSGAGLKDRPKLGFVKVLEKRVKKLHLQNAVRFWGGRFGEEKYRLLSRAHVFVNPSVHPGETLGLANIDALACGLPIVVTRWGGPEEVIKDGENGYRVDVHWGVGGKKDVDRERLVSGISEILNNNALAKRMGRNSRRIAKRFDVRTAMPRLARILAKASKMPRTPGRWVAMKDKTPFDFRDIFRPEMLFFLPFSPGVHQTYESLWKQYQQRVASRVVPLSPRSMLRPLRPCESSVFKNVRIELAKYLRGSL